jgi:hypothetical protein
MSNLPILARPKAGYWWSYVLVMPFAGLMLSALLHAVVTNWLDFQPAQHEVQAMWATATALLTLLVIRFDRTRLHYELTDTALQLGRGNSAQVLHFTELDSVVLGLPPHTPRWLRWMHFHPRIRASLRNLEDQRATALYLRFRDGRFLPLTLNFRWLDRGPELMAALRERLRESFVAHDSYTADEVAALKWPRWNRVRWLRERPIRRGPITHGAEQRLAAADRHATSAARGAPGERRPEPPQPRR